MKLRTFIILMIFCFFLISGCSEQNIVPGPKREITSYSEQTYNVEKPITLELTSDSSNVEVYSWDRKKIKFEITKRIRGIQDEEELENRLSYFQVDMVQEGSKVIFSSKYREKIKNPADISVDLKIFIPKKIDSINCRLDIGNLKFFDDIRCNLNAEIKTANININRLVGAINVSGDMSNLSINDGIIKGESNIRVNFGNISIKGELEEGKSYNFETGAGNIDIELPAESKLALESIGNLEVNEFISGLYPTQIKLNSGMGRITVRKF